MAILRCKMCGADLSPAENSSICTCDYCGSVQTIPIADDEKKIKLFGRAQRLLYACEFDKASGVYESIVAEFPEEAEAYWGLVLCKYGIEYVDDPLTGRKIPTCHRSSFDYLLDDDNYEQALENADPEASKVYRGEARIIEELRREIVEISSKAQPCDIFICYKETDANGSRTVDSVIAQDIYDALTEKGYRVFFSRISLEDKLGQNYEPYIFAAINSAKIMLVVGTDYDYFNSVWVKNEWSRFLKLIAAGEKKILIPCYRDIDIYDMPREFVRLQAQDMGKIGAMQDLLRGIDKLLGEDRKGTVGSPADIDQVQNMMGKIAFERGEGALNDGDWKRAIQYFEQTLDFGSQGGRAYLGLVMASLECGSRDAFCEYYACHDMSDDRQLRMARQEANDDLRQYFDTLDQARAHWIDAENEKRRRHMELMKNQKLVLMLNQMVFIPSEAVIAINSRGQILGRSFSWSPSNLVYSDNLIQYNGSHAALSLNASHVVFDNGTVFYTSGGMYNLGQAYGNIGSISDVIKVVNSGTIALRSDGTLQELMPLHGVNESDNEIVSGRPYITYMSGGSLSYLEIVSNFAYHRDKRSHSSERLSEWKDIVDICTGFLADARKKAYECDRLLFGLTRDGRVRALTSNDAITDQIEARISHLRDVFYITSLWDILIAVKRDGSVEVIKLSNEEYQWKLAWDPEDIMHNFHDIASVHANGDYIYPESVKFDNLQTFQRPATTAI